MVYENTWELIRVTNQTTDYAEATVTKDDWQRGWKAAESYLSKKQLASVELEASRALEEMMHRSATSDCEMEDYITARVAEEERKLDKKEKHWSKKYPMLQLIMKDCRLQI